MSFPATDIAPAPRGGGRGVLESAFALLGALEEVDGAGVSRLAAECGLPKTTAHRLLEQLSSLGVVERSRGGYRIGARVFQLGHGWQPHPGLRAAAREPMRRLAAGTGTTVSVSVLRKGRELTVDWVAGPGGSPVALRRGATWPWYTAAGKVLVAEAERVERGASVHGKHKARTAADALTGAADTAARASTAVNAMAPDGSLEPEPTPAWWRRESELIRTRGVAFDHEDVVSGVCCAAVPLYGAPGTAVAALCVITDPAHRLDRLADAARRVGAAISAALSRLPRS